MVRDGVEDPATLLTVITPHGRAGPRAADSLLMDVPPLLQTLK